MLDDKDTFGCSCGYNRADPPSIAWAASKLTAWRKLVVKTPDLKVLRERLMSVEYVLDPALHIHMNHRFDYA